MPAVPSAIAVRFSHIHLYTDHVRPLLEYKKLEAKLNDFAVSLSQVEKSAGEAGLDIAAGRQAWTMQGSKHGDPVKLVCEPDEFKPSGQDVVEQLLVGMGWRVTGCSGEEEAGATRSVVLTSSDPEGVRFVLTSHKSNRLDELLAPEEAAAKRARSEVAKFDHFDTEHLRRFATCHNGRQGIAVLGFIVPAGGLDTIRAKYAELHPKLLLSEAAKVYAGAKILEAYAYYKGETGSSDADQGTVLRFIEVAEDAAFTVLPGLDRVEAKFGSVSQPAYCDHWVSNVISRTGFLKTLEDTLGFTPKVDFNAGVVAAGEAQIESTVTGNSPVVSLQDKQSALRDQSQVYLPINNALSEVGHVNIFLREIGQGIQHIASRVEDLGALIQRANENRKMTGAGFSFLQVPMSYYGYLTSKQLAADAKLGPEAAERCLAALRGTGLLDSKNIVALEATKEGVTAALPEELRQQPGLAELILRARYSNLYKLLRDHLSEEAYLRIVRNNILVDIQGEDLLLQIFTSKVLMRNDGEEAPFLEFIQRICSESLDSSGCPRKIKPGCGGFGIRNFLTLFLSIEVSKASGAKAEAEKRGDHQAASFEARRVDAFTAQLDESNPILTGISDAMTAEGNALETGDTQEAQKWAAEKAKGNEALQECSSKYKAIMREIREAQTAAAATAS